MARVLPGAPPSRSLFFVGAALLALYLFAFKELSGVTNALLLGFAGLVVAAVLDLPAGWLARRIPRVIAVILVLIVGGGLLFVAARLGLPALAHQFGVLAAQVPAGLDRVWRALRHTPAVARVLPEHLDLSHVGVFAFGQVLPFVSGAFAVLGSVGIALTIGAFVCADPDADLRTLDALVPRRHRELVHEIVRRSAVLLRRWIEGSLITMAIVGVLTAVGLLLVGVHGWLALGLLAFAGALVPYLGSVVAGTAIVAAALADSPQRALAALGVYVAVQALLGSVIAPLVSKATIRTSPTLLLIFQLIMGASFGVLGILLAQPLLAVATVIVEARADVPRNERPSAR
jgi:predicted PurR-regulated permease PerM